MTKTYKLFRVYCFICIIVLCVLLVAVGFLTAKYQTEETVFKATYSTVRVYSSEENLVVNFAGNILQLAPDKIADTIEKIRPVVLAPVNNVIELIKAIANK